MWAERILLFSPFKRVRKDVKESNPYACFVLVPILLVAVVGYAGYLLSQAFGTVSVTEHQRLLDSGCADLGRIRLADQIGFPGGITIAAFGPETRSQNPALKSPMDLIYVGATSEPLRICRGQDEYIELSAQVAFMGSVSVWAEPRDIIMRCDSRGQPFLAGFPFEGKQSGKLLMVRRRPEEATIRVANTFSMSMPAAFEIDAQGAFGYMVSDEAVVKVATDTLRSVAREDRPPVATTRIGKGFLLFSRDMLYYSENVCGVSQATGSGIDTSHCKVRITEIATDLKFGRFVELTQYTSTMVSSAAYIETGGEGYGLYTVYDAFDSTSTKPSTSLIKVKLSVMQKATEIWTWGIAKRGNIQMVDDRGLVYVSEETDTSPAAIVRLNVSDMRFQKRLFLARGENQVVASTTDGPDVAYLVCRDYAFHRVVKFSRTAFSRISAVVLDAAGLHISSVQGLGVDRSSRTLIINADGAMVPVPLELEELGSMSRGSYWLGNLALEGSRLAKGQVPPSKSPYNTLVQTRRTRLDGSVRLFLNVTTANILSTPCDTGFVCIRWNLADLEIQTTESRPYSLMRTLGTLGGFASSMMGTLSFINIGVHELWLRQRSPRPGRRSEFPESCELGNG